MFSRATAIFAPVILLCAACGSSSDFELLESFRSDGVEYEFGISSDTQLAACVGVNAQMKDALTSTFACPTDLGEVSEFAGAIEVDGVGFVVGYGLGEGEIPSPPRAVRVLTTDGQDGRRFFVIQLVEPVGLDGLEVPIVATDGSQRSISVSAPVP